MRKTILVVASVALAVLIAGGGAYAATINSCPGFKNGQGDVCEGTPQDDIIHGGDLPNAILGLAGKDTIYAGGGGDAVAGGSGSDLLYGGPGADGLNGGGRRSSQDPQLDSSTDYVHGGRGPDGIRGGFAKGGVDRLYGEMGNDFFYASQRQHSFTPVTKEIIDCGPGNDEVRSFDKGLDVVKANCEHRHGF